MENNDSGSDITSERNQFIHQKFNPNKNEVNNFSARIANNGTATITSQSLPNNPAIASVNRSALGVVDITYSTGYFTVIPKVTLAASDSRIVYTSNETISGVTINNRQAGGTFDDRDFDIDLTRQGVDYKSSKE